MDLPEKGAEKAIPWRLLKQERVVPRPSVSLFCPNFGCRGADRRWPEHGRDDRGAVQGRLESGKEKGADSRGESGKIEATVAAIVADVIHVSL